jgi:hypothetical protein
MRQKWILFWVLLGVIALADCSVNTERTESTDNLPTEIQTEKQISGSEAVDSPTPTVEAQLPKEPEDLVKKVEKSHMKLQIGNLVFTATLVDNSTTAALKEMLTKGPVTINMRDYGNMEKVGPLGTNLPRNDEQIRTEAGDLILYQGNAFVIYYAPNSWNFTRIGKIDNVTSEELKEALGSGDVKVTLSLD